MEDELFLAWAAGFFDGEGCVLVSERKSAVGHSSSFQLYTTVTQQNPTALYKFKERFGGSVTPDKTATKGYDRKHGDFLCWRWKASSVEAFNFLKVIQPYTIAKAEQVVLALRWPDPGITYRGTYNAIPDNVRKVREQIMYDLRAARQKHKVDTGAYYAQ